jgi:ABC-type nitrate/sulfonate/bicarbonate transport system permease component
VLYRVADGTISGHVSWPHAVPLAFGGLFFAAGMSWWLGRPRR